MQRKVILEELHFGDMLGDGDLTEIQPVKHDDREGRESYEYSFGGIEKGLFKDINNPNIETRVTSRGIWWHYDGKPPIFIEESGHIYKRSWDSTKTCEKQAYFALNHMDSQGIVHNWRRR